MPKYIDADEFVRLNRKWYCETCEKRKGMKRGRLQFVYEIGDAPCRACDVDDVISDIEDFPAADVESVVRCKDCKHRPSMLTNEIGGRVLVFPGGDENLCPCQNLDDDWYSYNPDDDFFCAYGKKKEVEHENNA